MSSDHRGDIKQWTDLIVTWHAEKTLSLTTQTPDGALCGDCMPCSAKERHPICQNKTIFCCAIVGGELRLLMHYLSGLCASVSLGSGFCQAKRKIKAFTQSICQNQVWAELSIKVKTNHMACLDVQFLCCTVSLVNSMCNIILLAADQVWTVPLLSCG